MHKSRVNRHDEYEKALGEQRAKEHVRCCLVAQDVVEPMTHLEESYLPGKRFEGDLLIEPVKANARYIFFLPNDEIDCWNC